MIILRDKLFGVLFGDGQAMTLQEQTARASKEAKRILKENPSLSKKEALRRANDIVKGKVIDKKNGQLGGQLTGRNIRVNDEHYTNAMKNTKGQYVNGKGANAYKKHLDKMDKLNPLESGKTRREIYNDVVSKAREEASKASEMARNNTTNAAEAEKLGLFKRLKKGWNGMSTRNKVLVGGGAAALAAGGAYLAHKRRAKARASMEMED